MRHRKIPSRTALLLNGAAILVAGGSLAVVLRSTFFTDDIAPCKERYTSATRLSLDRSGVPMTPAELQGQLANSDWGLTSGAKVVPVKSGPARYALELDLAKVPGVVNAASGDRAGIGFNWSPSTFRQREAACLTYSVLPLEGFSFGKGGRLPGLQGSATRDSDGSQAGFSVRYAWNSAGELDTYPQLPQWPTGRALGGKHGKLALETGRWTEVEQEVVLNTPGKADGILRVWQDGRLAVQKSDVVFRTSSSVTLSGVLAETVGGAGAGESKRNVQLLQMTPFEIRWP